MKAIITILECAAASAVIVFILQDEFWRTTLGVVTLIIALAVILFGAWLYGVNHGVKIGQKDSSIRWDIGYQAGRNRKW